MELARIGKYEIVSRIGQGAMGEVYKAHDPVLNRFVAVKTMTGVLTSDDELVERFRREAQSAARLNHVNIVTVYDFGEEQGRFYMAMELLEGVDLKEVIGARGLNDLWDKLDVMEQVADGLAFAHAQGVVHRDLKPANIRVLPSGRVKIMDFGLARMNTSEMTRSGMVMGTPNYMSPEQVRGERADARSDVFALGAMFYELLAGRKAFQADSMHTILFKVLEEQPEPVERLVPDLPPRFVRLIERALEKDPLERFQHAGEMRDSLRTVREGLAAGDLDATAGHQDDTSQTMTESTAPTMIDLAAAPSPLVSGATALDVTHLRAQARPLPRPAPTLSGRSPTHPPRAGGPSRASVLGAAAVVAALALGVTFWSWAQRPGADPTPSSDITSAQVGAITAQLVGNQIELARADLQNKDYRGAIAQAERALRLDADSSEARQVIAEAEAQLAADPGPAATAHDPAIRRVIAEYTRAVEGKDLALFRAVKPNLSADEEKRLQDAFKAIKSQQVGITIDSIQVDGGQATVRVSRQDTINGKPMRAVHQTFRLVQGGPGWIIQTIGQ